MYLAICVWETCASKQLHVQKSESQYLKIKL